MIARGVLPKETVSMQLPEGGLSDETRLMVDMHLSIATRLLQDGAASVVAMARSHGYNV